MDGGAYFIYHVSQFQICDLNIISKQNKYDENIISQKKWDVKHQGVFCICTVFLPGLIDKKLHMPGSQSI